MHIVTVTGGKGGVGKSTIALNLAYILSTKFKTLLLDLDVDNPYTLTLKDIRPRIILEIEGFKPEFNVELCTFCMKCAFSCPTHAIIIIPYKKRILWFEQLCEGCGICQIVCPSKAIGKGRKIFGYVLEAEVDNLKILLGLLKPPSRKSVKIALETLNYPFKSNLKADFIVIDTPAGTNIVVKEALRKATSIILVTEPTPLGIHDLKRIIKLIEIVKGDIPRDKTIVVVNRANVRGGILNDVVKFITDLKLAYVLVPYDISIVKDSGKGIISIRENKNSYFADKIMSIARFILNLAHKDSYSKT